MFSAIRAKLPHSNAKAIQISSLTRQLHRRKPKPNRMHHSTGLHPAEPDDALLTQHLLHTSKAWQTARPSSTCSYQENSFYTPLKHRQLEQNALL